MSLGESVVNSTPSSLTVPVVGLMSCKTARPVVDLPQPLSPTRPSVSPRRIKRSTPSTALTCATVRFRRPPLMGKWTFRPLTSTSVVLSVSTAAAFISCAILLSFPLIWIETGRYLLATTYGHQFGSLLPAFTLHLGATRSVGTTRRRVHQIGGLPANRRQFHAALIIEARIRGQQAHRRRLRGSRETLSDGYCFGYMSRVH